MHRVDPLLQSEIERLIRTSICVRRVDKQKWSRVHEEITTSLAGWFLKKRVRVDPIFLWNTVQRV